MKKSTLIIVALLFSVSLFAQAPQKMSYQAVVRDINNNLLADKTVGMRVSVLQGSENGTLAYQESHKVKTNTNGLASIDVGTGTPISGTFSAINWASGSYYIKTETDPLGGTNYTIVGSKQLMSVPYAFYADKAGNTGGTMPNGKINGEMLYYQDGQWIKIPPGKNHQTLHFCNGVPRWEPCTPELPTAITKTGETTINSVTMLGKIENDGGSYIKEKGFVYSEVPKPTIETGTRVNKGMGSEDFSFVFTPSIGPLRVFLGIYYRAYAINDKGVSYGEEYYHED